jgi:hypothetical protein
MLYAAVDTVPHLADRTERVLMVALDAVNPVWLFAAVTVMVTVPPTVIVPELGLW